MPVNKLLINMALPMIISMLVQALYNIVKEHDSKLKFGISPQGNIDSDYNTQYADVELWTANQGYADYIVPQIYYGFDNEICPFTATLERWEELAKNGAPDGTTVIAKTQTEGRGRKGNRVILNGMKEKPQRRQETCCGFGMFTFLQEGP